MSAEIGGTVAVIDAKTYEVIKVVGFDIPCIPAELIQPTGIDFSKTESSLSWRFAHPNRVAVIDADSYEVKQYAGRLPSCPDVGLSVRSRLGPDHLEGDGHVSARRM